jgi:hypothetical protein
MDFLKTAGGKVVSGAVALAVVVAGIAFLQSTSAQRQAALYGTGKVVGWLLIVILLPFISFLLIARVEKMKSNTAGVVLVGVMTVLESLLLAWLFDFSIHGTTAWILSVAAVLLAGVYNTFACDWIAEKME